MFLDIRSVTWSMLYRSYEHFNWFPCVICVVCLSFRGRINALHQKSFHCVSSGMHSVVLAVDIRLFRVTIVEWIMLKISYRNAINFHLVKKTNISKSAKWLRDIQSTSPSKFFLFYLIIIYLGLNCSVSGYFQLSPPIM